MLNQSEFSKLNEFYELHNVIEPEFDKTYHSYKHIRDILQENKFCNDLIIEHKVNKRDAQIVTLTYLVFMLCNFSVNDLNK
jgi:hypothetical protein